MPIPEWKLKKEIIRIAFGQMRQNDVPDQILDSNNFNEDDYGFAWDNLLEMYGHRFDKQHINVGSNSKYRVFFRELSEQLACNEVVPGTIIIEGDALDFINILPKTTQVKLALALNQGGVQIEFRKSMEGLLRKINEYQEESILDDKQQKLKLFDMTHKSWYPIYYTPSEKLPNIAEGIRRGHIDQSLYYQNTDSVNRWFSITNDEFYTGFDQCKTGLLKLSRLKEWLDFISEANCDGIVMLCGGGAHSKDAVLIKCLLDVIKGRKGEPNNLTKLKYTLIDRSSAMLELSRSKIEELLDKREGHDFIEIKALRRDVMSMNGSEPLRGEGSIAWFNTGGTLGNLDEKGFFQSLESVSKVGDLLVLGVGCIDYDLTIDLSALAKEYERDVVRDLVAVPLSAVWSSLGTEETPEEALSSIKVEAIPDKHSSIPNAITVVARLPSKTLGDILLFKSSRYCENSLIEFVGSFNWELVVSVDGLDSSFKQMVFKKMNSPVSNS